MKTFVKSNGSLHSGNNTSIKVYSTLPSDLSDISEGEVIILEKAGFYQKENNSLTPLFDPSSLSVSDGAVGDIIAYYGTTNPDPDNFVICDGSTFSAADFPELYTLLGTNTTPDLTGYHLKGIGENPTWASHDAISLNTKVAANYPNHTHTTVAPTHSHSVSATSHYHTGVYSAYCIAYYNGQSCCCSTYYKGRNSSSAKSCSWTTNGSSISWNTFSAANLGAITVTCPTTASGYNAVRYGSETKCKDKTVLFLMRAKV